MIQNQAAMVFTITSESENSSFRLRGDFSSSSKFPDFSIFFYIYEKARAQNLLKLKKNAAFFRRRKTFQGSTPELPELPRAFNPDLGLL